MCSVTKYLPISAWIIGDWPPAAFCQSWCRTQRPPRRPRPTEKHDSRPAAASTPSWGQQYSLLCASAGTRTYTDQKNPRSGIQNIWKQVCKACWGQHLHRFLVWFEQLTGELTQDGQVWQVWRCRSLRCLTKLLEHKFYTVPVDHTQTESHSGPRSKQQVSAAPTSGSGRRPRETWWDRRK